MKGRYMMKVILVLCFLIFTTALAFAGGDDRKDVVVKLVSGRTDAMNGFYGSQISYWEAARQLREVETGRLLDEDIDRLKNYFRTDIEYIEDYEIKKVTFTESGEDMLCAVVEMDWQISGTGGIESLNHCYSVICEKEGDAFKLVQFF